MANLIKLKRSAVQGLAPTTTQLELGELAINTYDGKLFIKKNDGTESIVEIGAGGGGGASVTISSTAPAEASNGDLWWDSNNGILKIYYEDENSSQWVDASYNAYSDYITELEYIQSTFASLQNEITVKASLDSPTFTGTVVLPSTTSIGTVSSTEIGYLDGATSSIQTQLNAKASTSEVALKAPLASPTFTGTVTAPNLNLTNALGVQYGGTGSATLTANSVLLGNGTNAVQTIAPGTSGNILTSNGTTWVSSTPAPSFSTGKAIAMAIVFGA